MKKPLKWTLWAVAALAVGAAGYAFLKPSKPQTTYLTEEVKRADVRQTVSATGEISAAQLVDVGAQASGKIKHLYVKLGQHVEKGDLIAEIDSTTQLNALNTNKAKLET